jgi:hypothetical protein
MPHATLEEILEEAEALPPDARLALREVLNNEELSALVGILLMTGLLSLLEKTLSLLPVERQQLREELERAAAESGLVNKAETVRAVRGKYAHLPTGSEAFAALKQREIELEDRR